MSDTGAATGGRGGTGNGRADGGRHAPDPDLVDAHLRHARTRADAAHVELLRERVSLLRFGNRQVTYQHDEERALVRLRLVRGDREGWALVETADTDRVRTTIDRLAAALDLLPAGDPAPMPGPWSQPDGPAAACDATVAVTPAQRAHAFGILAGTVPDEISLGGSIGTRIVDTVVANTSGLEAAEQRTRAALQVIASGEHGSTLVRRIDTCWDRIDPLEAGAAAAAGVPGRSPLELPGGPARVLLGPQAVATFAATLAYIGLGAVGPGGTVGPFGMTTSPPRQPSAGTELAPMLSRLVSFKDDARDPAGLPAAFDCAGWPKRRVALIEAGHPAGVVHDVRTAMLAGTDPTGHTAPPGWRFGSGPSPSHLIVAAGDQDVNALRQRVDDGLVIERVDYVRVVQPRQGLVTGTTRDGTRLVRGGRVIGPVPQFRFTIGLVELFRSIEAVGSQREQGEAPFIDAVVAPAMVSSAFPIDAVARR